MFFFFCYGMGAIPKKMSLPSIRIVLASATVMVLSTMTFNNIPVDEQIGDFVISRSGTLAYFSFSLVMKTFENKRSGFLKCVRFHSVVRAYCFVHI